jgi:hypothetical protein
MSTTKRKELPSNANPSPYRHPQKGKKKGGENLLQGKSSTHPSPGKSPAAQDRLQQTAAHATDQTPPRGQAVTTAAAEKQEVASMSEAPADNHSDATPKKNNKTQDANVFTANLLIFWKYKYPEHHDKLKELFSSESIKVNAQSVWDPVQNCVQEAQLRNLDEAAKSLSHPLESVIDPNDLMDPDEIEHQDGGHKDTPTGEGRVFCDDDSVSTFRGGQYPQRSPDNPFTNPISGLHPGVGCVRM